MLRLFISLYLVIISGLFFIGVGSELLWSKLNTQPSKEQQPWVKLVKGLPALITNEQQAQAFEQQSGVALNLIALSDIAWLDEQLTQLKQGEAVSVYDHQDQRLVYILAKDPANVLQLGPIQSPTTNTLAKYVVLFISYVLLALFVALWTQPVWRDLNKLKMMADKVADNDFNLPSEITTRSPVSPIVNTMHDMANHITRLIAEQKQLVNAVSHELRTPLSRLRFSLALVEHLNEDQQLEISQDIDEIENLIDEMLSYSRLEYITQQQQKTTVDVKELLINQIDKLQRGCAITLEHDLATSLTCFGHGDLIERASQNLITNAMRHAKSKVSVKSYQKDQQLFIVVSDDGIGIAAENRESVFTPFSRIDNSRNKALGGYGLGLAIVKKVADWHHGYCQISQSSLGGAEFTLILPINRVLDAINEETINKGN